MTKLGILVGEENWVFMQELLPDLAAHHQTSIFRPKTYNVPLLHGRINRWTFRAGIQRMLRQNDVCFFEWASDLLRHASHMPKSCAIVTRLHSFELHEWAHRICWDRVDKVILVSEAMQEMFVELYPAQQHKTVVIYNGKSLAAYKMPTRKPFRFQLGMLCNISPIKRIYEVILLVHQLKEQGYDPTLAIAGKPLDLRYTAAVQRLVHRLGLQEQVTFDGYVTDTPAWLQKIDIFLSNSFWEGQQVALIEAMASGCYCLAHSWAGAEEMLPAENIYLTDTQLQQKMIDYSEQPEAERLRRQHRLRTLACEKFDIKRTSAQLRQVIHELQPADAESIGQ